MSLELSAIRILPILRSLFSAITAPGRSEMPWEAHLFERTGKRKTFHKIDSDLSPLDKFGNVMKISENDQIKTAPLRLECPRDEVKRSR